MSSIYSGFYREVPGLSVKWSGTRVIQLCCDVYVRMYEQTDRRTYRHTDIHTYPVSERGKAEQSTIWTLTVSSKALYCSLASLSLSESLLVSSSCCRRGQDHLLWMQLQTPSGRYHATQWSVWFGTWRVGHPLHCACTCETWPSTYFPKGILIHYADWNTWESELSRQLGKNRKSASLRLSSAFTEWSHWVMQQTRDIVAKTPCLPAPVHLSATVLLGSFVQTG